MFQVQVEGWIGQRGEGEGQRCRAQRGKNDVLSMMNGCIYADEEACRFASVAELRDLRWLPYHPGHCRFLLYVSVQLLLREDIREFIH